MENDRPPKSPELPHLSRFDIEELAEKTLKSTYPLNLQLPSALQTRDLLDAQLGLLVKDAYIGDYDSGILGLTVMSNEVDIPVCDHMLRPEIWSATYGTVIISERLAGAAHNARRRYTEAHEAAHWLLHRDYFNALSEMTHNPSCYIACREIERYRSPRTTDRDWCEWQADTMAASMLMPRDIFSEYVSGFLSRSGVRGHALVQGNPDHRRVFNAIIGPIANAFGVSRRAAQIRMIHLGLIIPSS